MVKQNMVQIPFSVKHEFWKGVVKGCTLKIILAVHKPSLYTKLKLYLFYINPPIVKLRVSSQVKRQT